MTNLVRGAAGTILGQWCKLIIQLAAIAILSRILEPSVFGIYAVILAIAGIAAVLGDFGLSLAAVQAPTLGKDQADNLFWTNSAIGLCATVLVIVAARPTELALGTTGSTHPMQVLSVVFLINGIAAQFKAQLNRDLKFGRLAMSDVIGQALALIGAVILALNGGGVWSLVAQPVAAAIITLGLLVYSSSWFPGWPHRSVSIRGFLSFGIATSGTQVVNYISTNIDVVLITRLLGAAVAGVYSRAFQLFALPLQQIASPLTRVAVPLLARATSDVGRNRRICQAQRLMSYSLLPILAFIAAASHPVVAVLLGDGWGEAALYLPVLAAGGVFQSMGYVYYWAFLACDRMSVLFVCELVGRTFMIAMMFVLAPYGAIWVAASYSVGLAVIWMLTTLWGLRYLTVSRGEILKSTLRPALLAASLYAMVRLTAGITSGWNLAPALQLILCCAIAAGTIVLLRWIPLFAGDVAFLRSVLSRLRADPQVSRA